MPPVWPLLRALALLVLWASAAAAQTFERSIDGPVALIADEILYDADEAVVTARGNVEVYQGGRTLTADEITYDDRTGRIGAKGDIVLRTETGETVYADMADLDQGLRDGVIQGARTVMADGIGKIAAAEARRLEGRYNLLEKAVFSPCEVCAARPVPLWRIRARRILQDEEEGQIHYDDAYFDVMGVTVGYLPYFRHPSPEISRASGFLAPVIERDRNYGAAVKLPYHLVLDEASDVTLTPFLSYSDGALLEVEYRRLFERGGFVDVTVITGVTNYGDDGRGARGRIGGFGAARYNTEGGVRLGLNLQIAADDPFFRRYDYTDDDRLTTELFARYYQGRSFASVEAAYLQSLRTTEPQQQIPFVGPDVSLRYAFDAPGIGGEAALTADGLALIREDGRDVGRISLGADWSRQEILSSGLALRAFADVRLDHYRIGDDPAFDNDATRIAPRGGLEARMPFIRFDDMGTHVLEPILQIVASPEDIEDGDIPNEDSVLAEFDEINLFETDRQPGFDRYESGTRVTIGGRYELIGQEGLSLRAAGGRVIRFDEISDFSAGAGLNDDSADWVAGLDASHPGIGSIRTSLRFSDDFGIERAEIGGEAELDPFSFFTSYLFIDDDAGAASPIDRSEIIFGGALEVSRNWTFSAEARRDLIRDEFVTAGAVLAYEDECAGLDLYARRQFTESVSTPEGTTVGFRVRLFGGDGGDRSKASGVCAFGAGE